MKKILINLLVVLFLGASMVSCKKMLETNPQNSLDLNFALSTREGLQATLVAIYNSMQGSGFYGRDVIVSPEVLADNCEITSNNTNRFINTANNAPGSHMGGLWSICYSNIFRANLIIQNVDASAATAAEKTAWKGEAQFIRALCYFNLVNIFGRNPQFLNSAPPGNFDLGVPIIKEAIIDAAKITYPPRNTVNEVYTFIMEDLNAANNLLTNAGLNASTNRPRRVAAQALASRVELYRGNWSEAERWADLALASGAAPIANATQYFNVSAGSGSWGNAFPETIFGLTYSASEPNPGGEGLQYIYYRNLPLGIQGYGDVHATASLRTDLGTVDRRFTQLISAQVKSGQNVFFTMKWPGPLSGRVLGQDDIMILRSSEVLLNRAEARARQGGAKEALAIADINQTRTRAGLTAFPTTGPGTPTGAALITEVLKERRIELAFEGHRLWDILRTGRDVIKSPTNILFGAANYNFLIAGIPQGDRDVNANLVNNPGY